MGGLYLHNIGNRSACAGRLFPDASYTARAGSLGATRISSSAGALSGEVFPDAGNFARDSATITPILKLSLGVALGKPPLLLRLLDAWARPMARLFGLRGEALRPLQPSPAALSVIYGGAAGRLAPPRPTHARQMQCCRINHNCKTLQGPCSHAGTQRRCILFAGRELEVSDAHIFHHLVGPWSPQWQVTTRSTRN